MERRQQQVNQGSQRSMSEEGQLAGGASVRGGITQHSARREIGAAALALCHHPMSLYNVIDIISSLMYEGLGWQKSSPALAGIRARGPRHTAALICTCDRTPQPNPNPNPIPTPSYPIQAPPPHPRLHDIPVNINSLHPTLSPPQPHTPKKTQVKEQAGCA